MLNRAKSLGALKNVELVDLTESTTSDLTNITLNVPSAAEVGDYLVFVALHDLGGNRFINTYPQAWYPNRSDDTGNANMTVATKLHNGDEPTSYTFSRADSGTVDYAAILAFRNTDLGNTSITNATVSNFGTNDITSGVVNEINRGLMLANFAIGTTASTLTTLTPEAGSTSLFNTTDTGQATGLLSVYQPMLNTTEELIVTHDNTNGGADYLRTVLHFPTEDKVIPALGSTSSAESASTIYLTVPKPTGVEAGDLLFLNLSQNGNTPTTGIHSDYPWIYSGTQTINSISLGTFYRIATANEPSSYQFSYDITTANSYAATISVIKDGVLDQQGATSQGTAGANATLATITPTDEALMLISAHYNSAGVDATDVYITTHNYPLAVITDSSVAQPVYSFFSSNDGSATGNITVFNGAANAVKAAVTSFISGTNTAIDQPTLVGAETAAKANPLTINVPSGVADGDILLAAVTSTKSGTTFTTPSGWTLVDSDNTVNAALAVYSRTASSEPASYDFTASNALTGFIVAFRNASLGNNSGIAAQTNNPIIVTSSISATGGWLVHICAEEAQDRDFYTANGMTIKDVYATTSTDSVTVAALFENVVTGTTGTRTIIADSGSDTAGITINIPYTT